jgi:SAM-dependent methyltransferase
MDRLAEQRDYYRQRAPEYDEWWQRRGRYELDPQARDVWFADMREVEQALDAFGPAGDVLELAAGTGWWTRHLVRHARQVTAVDASAEVLELNRRRAGPRVTYLQADLFDWTPPAGRFDVVFFGYWLSHVPDERVRPFFDQVAAALRPGGRVFLVDSFHHVRLDGDLQPRVLNDGRGFTVVKRYWQPAELAEFGATAGWHLDARVTTHRGMLYAAGSYSRSSR